MVRDLASQDDSQNKIFKLSYSEYVYLKNYLVFSYNNILITYCSSQSHDCDGVSMNSLQICRNLRFTWDGESLDSISLLINKPDAPIKLRFENLYT